MAHTFFSVCHSLVTIKTLYSVVMSPSRHPLSARGSAVAPRRFTVSRSSQASPASAAAGLNAETVVAMLLDDPKASFRLKLLRATRRLLAERGLDVSMDEIADAAGVNRRTLFRHVESRDALVADAMSASMDWFDAHLDLTPVPGLSLDDWITDMALRMIEFHHRAGRGLWQLAATRDEELSPALAAVNARRRRVRRAGSVAMARAVWRHASGDCDCPVAVLDAVALAISSFSVRSMVDDFGRRPAALARSIGTLLASLVRAQVEIRRAAQGATPGFSSANSSD